MHICNKSLALNQIKDDDDDDDQQRRQTHKNVENERERRDKCERYQCSMCVFEKRKC